MIKDDYLISMIKKRQNFPAVNHLHHVIMKITVQDNDDQGFCVLKQLIFPGLTVFSAGPD